MDVHVGSGGGNSGDGGNGNGGGTSDSSGGGTVWPPVNGLVVIPPASIFYSGYAIDARNLDFVIGIGPERPLIGI